jgi:hypothetical protein
LEDQKNHAGMPWEQAVKVDGPSYEKNNQLGSMVIAATHDPDTCSHII